MDKTASTDHLILDLLAHRWSPRAFADRSVASAKLRSLLEAARWAPSASNLQPWRLIVATREQPEEHARLLSTLVESNQVWARPAPVLLIAVAQELTGSGRANAWARYDLGQAMAHLSVQAEALGLSVHQMGGFSADAARELYGIPEGYAAVTAAAIGYLGDPDALPLALAERERAARTRLPQSELFFTGTWGAAV